MGMSLQTFLSAYNTGNQINADLEHKRATTEYNQAITQQMQQKTASDQAQAKKMQDFSSMVSKKLSEQDQEWEKRKVEDGELPDAMGYKKLEFENQNLHKLSQAAYSANLPEKGAELEKAYFTNSAKLSEEKKRNEEIALKQRQEIGSGAAFFAEQPDIDQQQAGDFVKDKFGSKKYLQFMTLNADKQRQFMEQLVAQGSSTPESYIAIKNAQTQNLEKNKIEREKIKAKQDALSAKAQASIGLKSDANDRAERRTKAMERNMQLKEINLKGGGARQAITTSAAVGFGKQAEVGLDQLSSFPVESTTGIFRNFSNGEGFLSSLRNVAGNEFTSKDAQMMNTATAGVAVEVANMAMIGSGRSATDSVKNEFKKMVEVQPGDTQATVAYKISHAVDFMISKLDSMPTHPDPKVENEMKKLRDKLETYPRSKDILAIVFKQDKGNLISDYLDEFRSKTTKHQKNTEESASTQEDFPKIDSATQTSRDKESLSILNDELENAQIDYDTAEPKLKPGLLNNINTLKREILNKQKSLGGTSLGGTSKPSLKSGKQSHTTSDW